MAANGQHGCRSPEWGTDRRSIWLAREVLGGRVDVDPASSPHWNKLIGAGRIITKKQDCRKTPWVPGSPAPHALSAKRRLEKPKPYTAFVNGPGTKDGELLAFCWRTLAAYFELGWISSAIWQGFSIEQTSRFQRIGAASHPLEHVTLIPCRRLHYRARRGKKSQPSHASFITLLTRSPAQVRKFEQLGADIGCVIRGARWQ